MPTSHRVSPVRKSDSQHLVKIVPHDTTHPRVLIVEDHARTSAALRTLLERKAYDVALAGSVAEALKILEEPNAPRLALLDWNLPDGTGLDIVHALRKAKEGPYVHCIVVTARDGEEDVALALAAGADDFLRKPCGPSELIARVNNGARVIGLQRQLEDRIADLEKSVEERRQLERLLPICMYCKKVRDDSDYWQEIESYLHNRTGTDFSRGICPECMKRVAAESQD